MIRLWPLVRPVLLALPPETAHGLALGAVRSGVARAPRRDDDPVLGVDLWGRHFPNPIGIAAGFDKQGEAVDPLLRLGFGFVEVGSVTPRPQPGNPRPRVFRSRAARAVINRMGFNSDGHAAVRARLRGRAGGGTVGVNLGRNKDSADAEADYAAGIEAFAELADYLVVNVSSPNTPGLRTLQDPAPLASLLAAVLAARARQTAQPPVLLKIAPDLADADLAAIAEIALGVGIDGLIVTNTTIARPASLPRRFASRSGGLSGKPLFEPSTAVLRRMAGLLAGRLPLVGVGGVSSGADAYAKIRAGATLVQLYSALVFEGPGLVGRIKAELAARLRADGFEGVAGAVGADLR
jgi:dihydroorotate dehydrogenase